MNEKELQCWKKGYWSGIKITAIGLSIVFGLIIFGILKYTCALL